MWSVVIECMNSVFTIQVTFKCFCCGPLGGWARAVHRHGGHPERVFCPTLQTWTGSRNQSHSKLGYLSKLNKVSKNLLKRPSLYKIWL